MIFIQKPSIKTVKISQKRTSAPYVTFTQRMNASCVRTCFEGSQRAPRSCTLLKSRYKVGPFETAEVSIVPMTRVERRARHTKRQRVFDKSNISDTSRSSEMWETLRTAAHGGGDTSGAFRLCRKSVVAWLKRLDWCAVPPRALERKEGEKCVTKVGPLVCPGTAVDVRNLEK